MLRFAAISAALGPAPAWRGRRPRRHSGHRGSEAPVAPAQILALLGRWTKQRPPTRRWRRALPPVVEDSFSWMRPARAHTGGRTGGSSNPNRRLRQPGKHPISKSRRLSASMVADVAFGARGGRVWMGSRLPRGSVACGAALAGGAARRRRRVSPVRASGWRDAAGGPLAMLPCGGGGGPDGLRPSAPPALHCRRHYNRLNTRHDRSRVAVACRQALERVAERR